MDMVAGVESVGTKMGALAPYIRRRRHSRWGKWVRADGPHDGVLDEGDLK